MTEIFTAERARDLMMRAIEQRVPMEEIERTFKAISIAAKDSARECTVEYKIWNTACRLVTYLRILGFKAEMPEGRENKVTIKWCDYP